MWRDSSFCDFCGSPEVLIAYPTDQPGLQWYACPECALLIDREEWQKLVDRCLAAYRETRVFSADDKRVIADQVAALVSSFRSCRLVPA